MRRSRLNCVQSGGSVSSAAWKSSASATAANCIGAVAPTIEPVIATTEYERLRETVGLVHRSQRGRLVLTGAETLEFLQGQGTNDVEAPEPGHGCYAALLDHKGKLLADMRVLRMSDSVWLDCEEIG